jgi:hypothetical protein
MMAGCPGSTWTVWASQIFSYIVRGGMLASSKFPAATGGSAFDQEKLF